GVTDRQTAMSIEEVAKRLDELYALGPGPGAQRPGLSDLEEEAHRLVGDWMVREGLEVDRDPAGNLFGRLKGARPGLAEIWCGSRLARVRGGGRYDGALGVVAALEAVRRIDTELERTITVTAFCDEEGWRFGNDRFGSRAVAGMLESGALDRCDEEETTVRE